MGGGFAASFGKVHLSYIDLWVSSLLACRFFAFLSSLNKFGTWTPAGKCQVRVKRRHIPCLDGSQTTSHSE